MYRLLYLNSVSFCFCLQPHKKCFRRKYYEHVIVTFHCFSFFVSTLKVLHISEVCCEKKQRPEDWYQSVVTIGSVKTLKRPQNLKSLIFNIVTL